MHVGREKLDAIRYQADRHWEERKYRMDDTFNVEFKRTTQWVEICIPSKAKITMNRKRRNSKLRMDRTLLNRDVTKLRKEDQYLVQHEIRHHLKNKRTSLNFYLVNLKSLKSLKSRSTDIPKLVPSAFEIISSIIPQHTT
ncbi:hypothetical protein pdam_00021159 [Pocillopora damicornis]|uniref:Uncharacterized protein n=1 Tax=Pocillopora damicornis TaxID=46731 RepID=A0A3M6US72_POCDA|nr:hypothetical protein pdam_00021159 [Pocillopora damicornis]